MESFAYSFCVAPKVYCCSGCGKTGVKLWRDYQTFLESQALLCAPCAMEEQGKTGEVGIDGKRIMDEGGMRTDQIGWRVPAVPTEDGETFFGYTSVPQARVDWWKNLPT